MTLSKALLILTLLALSSLVQATPTPATATQKEVRAGWQSYWTNERNLIPKTVFPFQECFEKSAKAHHLPLSLLIALSRGESNFNPKAISKANARGLMQILWPGTAKYLGINSEKALFDPCTNVDGGARYLKELMERYNNNIHLSLAAYNYGPGRIAKDAVKIQDGAAWYSGYIYNHVRYVLGQSAPKAARVAPANYDDEQRLIIQTFWDGRRAEGFVNYLRELVPTVRLDWFDRGLGRYSIVLLYQDQAELDESSAILAKSGFTVK